MDDSTSNIQPSPATVPAEIPPGGPAPRMPSLFNELSILFPLLSIYTVGYMGLMAAEFFLRGVLKVPSGLMPVYIALVGAMPSAW